MENKTIEALEKLIAIKDETIKELEKQIQLLKSQPTITLNPPIGVPYNPYPLYGNPGTLPFIQTPNPLRPPFTITSGVGPVLCGTNLLSTHAVSIPIKDATSYLTDGVTTSAGSNVLSLMSRNGQFR